MIKIVRRLFQLSSCILRRLLKLGFPIGRQLVELDVCFTDLGSDLGVRFVDLGAGVSNLKTIRVSCSRVPCEVRYFSILMTNTYGFVQRRTR